jgi:hemoglobin
MEKKEIKTEADVQLLIDTFYEKVIHDPIIGFIFTDVLQLSWEKHIPIMYAFWGSILLENHTYSGNPMMKHIELDRKITLTPIHFERWLELWEENVNAHFVGALAEEAVKRAKLIAPLMLHKVEQSRG